MSAEQNKNAKLEEVDVAPSSISVFGLTENTIPKNWILGQLDTLAYINPDSICSTTYTYSEIAYLDITNVTSGAIGKPITLPLKDAPSRAKRIVKHEDVILSTVRPGNRAYAFIKHAPNNLIVSTGFAVFRAKRGISEPRFIYYLISSNPIINYLASVAEEKTAYPSVNPDDIAECIVPIPPLEEQKAIAHILGTLDDKIELNRRTNETLEAMAQALFKFWFVDFGPVRAKMEGRWRRGQSLPGLPAHLFDLFPDRLVDSELGEIPEGWEVGTLGDIAENPRRGIQSNQVNMDTPYIALEHMPKKCIALSNWDIAEGLESNKFKFKIGEILFGKLRPYFHKVGIAPVDGICSTDILVITPKDDKWFGLVLCCVSNDTFIDYTNAGSTGTKMPRTSWSEMVRYQLVVPPKSVAGAFTKYIKIATDKITTGIYESHTLAAIRDTLLPKLISGELRVKQTREE